MRWTEDFKFNGIKTFMGAPVYALLHNGDGHEDYFDLKSFQFLGSAGAKDSWTTNYFGFRDFGGAVLPQFRLYHNGSNIRLAKLEGLQLDVPPQVETDLFALAFTQVNNFPVLKPILTHAIKNNALDQSALLLQNVGKLETVHDTQFGLDNAAQEQRRGLIARLKAEVNDVDQKHKQWDDIGKAVMGVVIQHDRVRRFKNPTGAADVYLNWRDVTNLDSLLKHKSIRVERKVSFSGSNATLEYCAMDDQGDRRNEAVNSFLDVQNKERQVSFDLKKRSVTSHYEYTELTPELLVRNNLSRCLFSVGEAAMIYYMLPKTRYGTGKLNQRDALVIMLPDPDGNDGTYYFFDKETYVLLGHKYHKDGEPISYYDFRQVGEAIIPFKEYEYTGGQYPSDSIRSIEKIDLDVPIDAKEFALDPPVYQNLHATELREKRAELYKTGGSVWGALLTGTLQGLAGGGNSPILEAGNRSAAQLRALGDQIAARQLAQKAVNLNARPMSGVNVPQPQIAAAQQITVAIDRSQLQALAGLVQANSDAGGQDATSALLLGTLKGLSGENDSPILAAGNEQAAALRQIGDANAAAHNSPPADSTGSATGAGSSTGNASATGTASASANAGASSSPTHHTGTSPMATNCLRVVKDRDSYKFTNTCSSIIQVAVAQPYPDGRPNGAMTFQLFPNDSYRDGDSSDSRLHYWACMGSNGPADANTMAAPRSDSANVICPTGGNAGVAY